MPENVEIKARLRDPEAVRTRVEALADAGPELLEQTDTFFGVEAGRLKLREHVRGRSELIFYRRDDRAGPKRSVFWKVPCDEPEGLRALLAEALGEAGTVRKRRELFLIGQTRVHLDVVEGLGAYVELEVVLGPDQTEEEGVGIAEKLLDELGIHEAELESLAYIDLLRQRPT